MGERVMQPHQYRHRVLLVVSGLSPQIITETIYALAVAAPSDDRFAPTCVEAITTSEGAERIRKSVLDRQSGSFKRLCDDYGLAGINFQEEHVHCVRDAAGQPLPDIRSPEDNARMADAIAERVRELTSDADCALHVSLAGGRKTMGFYAGYAMSLFGREQDRLSHVLVSEPFETAPDFWYPRPQPEMLRARGLPAGVDMVSTAQARVSLAMIPFVRLREGLPAKLLSGCNSFAETVTAANARFGPPHLVLDIARHAIEADGQRLALSPTQFALMAALAQRQIKGMPPLHAPLRDAHDAHWADVLLADLRSAVGLMNVPAAVEESLRKECSGAKLSPHLSKLRRRLAEALAPGRAALYFEDGGSQKNKRYRVPLRPDAIRFVRP